MAQRNGRIHRINSTFESVDIINMITNDTIDEKIQAALTEKQAISDGLIERSVSEQDVMKQLLSELND